MLAFLGVLAASTCLDETKLRVRGTVIEPVQAMCA